MTTPARQLAHSVPSPIGVIYCAAGWQIVKDGRRWGRYRYRVDAEEAALRLVRGETLGYAPLILVQQPWGELIALPADAPSPLPSRQKDVLRELRRPDKPGRTPIPLGIPPQPHR